MSVEIQIRVNGELYETQVAPVRCWSTISGTSSSSPARTLGIPGFVDGVGHIELAEEGGQTELRYTREAQVGGMIASVVQRMIERAARKVVDQFFAAASEELKVE
jgi:carbon monoxide dehydrogenase subunit G